MASPDCSKADEFPKFRSSATCDLASLRRASRTSWCTSFPVVSCHWAEDVLGTVVGRAAEGKGAGDPRTRRTASITVGVEILCSAAAEAQAMRGDVLGPQEAFLICLSCASGQEVVLHLPVMIN